jgi:hypothetical protein
MDEMTPGLPDRETKRAQRDVIGADYYGRRQPWLRFEFMNICLRRRGGISVKRAVMVGAGLVGLIGRE